METAKTEELRTEYLTREFGNKNCLHSHFSYTFDPEYVASIANILKEDFLTLLLEWNDWGHTPLHDLLEAPGLDYVSHLICILRQIENDCAVNIDLVAKEFIKAAFRMAHYEACVLLTQEFGFDFDDEEISALWSDLVSNRIEDYQVTPNELFWLLVILCLELKHPLVNPTSALLVLASREDENYVHSLLQLGADPRVKNEDGETPLLLAAKSAYYPVFKLLIDELETADVNASDNQSMTSLLVLCSKLSRDPVLLNFLQDLERKGADFTALDSKGRNCLFHVFSEHLWCKQNALFVAERLGDKLCELMLAADCSGQTPLQLMLSCNISEKIQSIVALSPELGSLFIEPSTISSFGNGIDTCLGCEQVFESGDSELVMQCKHRFHELCFSKWPLLWSTCPYCHVAAFLLNKN